MAKNEAFKAVSRRGTGLWSWWAIGPAAVRYSDKYWTKPKCESWMGKGKRLSVFSSLSKARVWLQRILCEGHSSEIWRCTYRGKPKADKHPAGTLRVTSVKLIKKVWPEDGSK